MSLQDGALRLDDALVAVGAHDALTAALVEESGFDIVWVSSFEVSSSRRLPDTNIVTYPEMAEIVQDIGLGCGLPIYVDADNGYGSDDCALRALCFFAGAGATAVCMEDNAFPKRDSLYPDNRALEDPEIFAERIAKLAAADTGVLLIARTEALVAGYGVDEAVRRLEHYASAGADALFVQVNREHSSQLPKVLAQVKGKLPMVIAPTVLPDLSAGEFFSMGANVVIFANVVTRSCIAAVARTLATLREAGSLRSVANEIVTLDEMFRLTRTGAWHPRQGVRRSRTAHYRPPRSK